MEFVNQIVAGIIGGLILNIMPCVLPVLAFKVQGWIHQADASKAERRQDALAFLAGALATFAAFALIVTLLRASGQSIGWGMHMQNSGFVAFLVALLFAFGLNAIGVFELIGEIAQVNENTLEQGLFEPGRAARVPCHSKGSKLGFKPCLGIGPHGPDGRLEQICQQTRREQREQD